MHDEEPLCLDWYGGLFVRHSLSLVNRELCLGLLGQGFSLTFHPTEPDDFDPLDEPRLQPLKTCREQRPEHVDVTVRHHWPPDFSPVERGRLVVIQPWEYGSVPAAWVQPINDNLDELWVPSSFVRECYIAGGVRADKVQVVPNGVNTDIFSPGAPPRTLATGKKFRFLFVGGTISRKGIDVLLAAYAAAFTAADDVCLVIKDMGGNGIYKGQTAGEMIRSFMSRPEHPELLYLDDMLDDRELAGLYTACHCLVHPYRGEGFGLPIAEAMACGLPPIVTGLGAALEFCPPRIAWLIPAEKHLLAKKAIGDLETVDYPWLAEPDFGALAALMRHAVEHPQEVTQRGQAAARHIRENFTWDHAAGTAQQRLLQLVRRDEPQQGPKPPVVCLVEEPVGRAGEEGVATSVQAACHEAEKLARRGELDAAVRVLLQEGIRADAASPAPYLVLARMLLNNNRFQDALGVVAEMPPATDRCLVEEIAAQCYCALGEIDDAKSAAEQAGSDRPLGLVVLGTLAARQGDLAAGEHFFRRAVDRDAGCGSAWLSLGMLLWGRGEQSEAWQAVKRAVIADPLHSGTVTIARDMANRLALGSELLGLIGPAVERFPDSRHLALLHAQLLAECGRKTAALAECERFLADFGADDEILALAPALLCDGKGPGVGRGREASISLCMIVKNEERHLGRCLASVASVVDEMVVVDTGSTDRTVAIARAFGARVEQFRWTGSFSDARNYSIEMARGTWILSMDADEVIAEQDHDTLLEMLATSSPATEAWNVPLRIYSDRVQVCGWRPHDGSYPEEQQAQGWFPAARVRLFPRDSRVRYEGVIHEMVEPSLRAHGFTIRIAPVCMHNFGEAEGLSPDFYGKQQRYYELGKRKLAENPDDLVALAELGVQAGELGYLEEALAYWDRLLELRPDTVEALFGRGHALLSLGRYQEGMAASLRAVKLEPDHCEAAFNYGTCELYVGEPERALAPVDRALRANERHPLLLALKGILCLSLGRREEALKIHRSLTAQNFSLSDYLRNRVATLQAIGAGERARIIILHASALGIDEGSP